MFKTFFNFMKYPVGFYTSVQINDYIKTQKSYTPLQSSNSKEREKYLIDLIDNSSKNW